MLFMRREHNTLQSKLLSELRCKNDGENMSDIKFERYRLVLRHEFVDGEEIHEIEKPIVISYCVDRRYGGSSIIINEMIDRLRNAILNEEE